MKKLTPILLILIGFLAKEEEWEKILNRKVI